MGVHKTANGAYRYRYAPFLMSTYYVMGCSPLALPLGELSPQVTERVVQSFLNGEINLYAHTTKIHLAWPLFPLSVFAALSHLSHWERQGVLFNSVGRVFIQQFDKPIFPIRKIGKYFFKTY